MKSSNLFFGRVRVAHFFAFVLSFNVSLRYDFRIKTMFGSSLPPVVYRRVHVLFTLFVFACA